MDINPATALDIVAFGVVLVSSLLALTRGLIRESLSIASFVVATLATIFTYPIFRTVTESWIESELIATIVTAAVIFLGVYALMTFATHKLSDLARRNAHIGMLDRIAGFGFGVVRGMVMLALVLLGWNYGVKPNQTPDWVTQARVYPAIAATSEALKSLIPDSRLASISTTNTTRPDQTATEQGYDQNDRKTLDQVVSTKLKNEEKDEPTEPNPQK